MKRIASFAVLVVTSLAVRAMAMYSLTNRGTWPVTWPKELESLRAQSRTLEHMDARSIHYAIRFKNHAQAEATWPFLLKVKSAGAPIFVTRGENFFLGEKVKSGIVIHCPPAGHVGFPAPPQLPIAGAASPRDCWRNTIYVEVVEDGDGIQWNRLKVPKGTPIIDERKLGAKLR